MRDVLIQSEILSGGSVDRVLSAKRYNCAVPCNKLLYAEVKDGNFAVQLSDFNPFGKVEADKVMGEKQRHENICWHYRV